jgi:hypothetical protein
MKSYESIFLPLNRGVSSPWQFIKEGCLVYEWRRMLVHYDSRISFLIYKVTTMSESQIKEIKRVYAGLETLYQTYFPKSDPSLIHDLLRRLKKNPNITPIYMVEVFTKPGVNTEAAKKYIFEKTGMVPAIYDNGLIL